MTAASHALQERFLLKDFLNTFIRDAANPSTADPILVTVQVLRVVGA